MPGTGLNVPKISIDGSPLPAAKMDTVVDVRVLQDMHAPSMATVRMYDPFFELLDGSTVTIGAKVEIAFPSAAGADVVVFKGKIAAVGSEQGASDRHELVFTAYDGSQPLAHSMEPASFMDMQVGDIVSKIAKRHGLSPKASGATMKLEYYLQVDTDHVTLDQLAAMVGAEWWVDGETLNFGKRKVEAPVKLEWGDSLRRISARFTAAGRADDVTVRGWDPDTQKAIVGKATRSSVDGSVGLDLTLASKRAKQATAMKGTIVVTDQPVMSADEAKTIATSKVADLAAGELRIKGEALGEPKVAAGKTIEIAKAGTQLSGKFVVARVEHVFGVDRPLVSRFEAGRIGPGGLADRLVNAERAERTARRVFAIGTVTNVKDPEKAGRVKVKLPAVSDKDESAWARVLTYGGGKDRGIEFMPDVGDEVVLGYLGGDARFPVVLGSLWSKKNTPPIPEPVEGDEVSKRLIVAKSGAKLVFTEGPKDKAVVELIHANAETKITLDKAGVAIDAKKDAKIVLKVGDASIELKGDGAISIKGGEITIKADKNLNIEGQKVTIKGATGVTVDGGGSKVDLQPAGAKISSSAITEIKGAMVKLN